MNPIKEEEELPFHFVDHHMGDSDATNPRGKTPPIEKNPIIGNTSAHNIYSISSTVTGSEIESITRLADIIR